MNRRQPNPDLDLSDDRTDDVLPLAEENDGSTLPVPSSAAARGSSDASSGASAGASGGASAAASQSESTGTAATSTGGFDTMLGKLVLNSGLVTADEMEQCQSLLSDAASADEPKTLGDVLLDNEFLTRRQLERLRGEFEAKKSSQSIPGYRIIKKLGAGAMATVFLAKQVSLDRLVAIKVLPKKFSDNARFIERFYKEGQAAAKLNHPNIVQAYDVGRAGEHHYFVMEYVDGQTAYDLVTKKKRVPEQDAISIVQQVAQALQHAHERGFIHRDIKPKNVMISKDSVVKLADLGLARAMSDKDAAKAEAGRAYGTPYYISPEQIRGEMKIGPQADIYGLGATFYHMVTGRVPFEGKNPSAVMHKHLKSELKPPDHINPQLSPGCAQVIEMMMAKDPKDRYGSVADLLTDLELVAKGESPHFARGTFGVSGLVTAEASIDQASAAAAAQPAVHQPAPNIWNSQAFLVVFMLLVLSLLFNIVLLALGLG